MEAVTGGVLLKAMFLDISQNSQENTYARASFLIFHIQISLGNKFQLKRIIWMVMDQIWPVLPV